MITTYNGYMAFVQSTLFAPQHNNYFPGYDGYNGSAVPETFAVDSTVVAERLALVMEKLNWEINLKTLPFNIFPVTIVVITSGQTTMGLYKRDPDTNHIVELKREEIRCLCCGQFLPSR